MSQHWLKNKCCSLAFWDGACNIKSAIGGMFFKWDKWGIACGYNQGWILSLSETLSLSLCNGENSRWNRTFTLTRCQMLKTSVLPQETNARETWVLSTTLYPLRYVYRKPVRSLSLSLAIEKGFQHTKVCHIQNPHVFTLQDFRVLILDWVFAIAPSTSDTRKHCK